MKNLRKILFGLVAIATVCSFTACGDDEEEEKGGNNNTTLPSDLPVTFAVQAKYAGQDFKTIHNRMLNAGCKYGTMILNDDEEWVFIEKKEYPSEVAHYYSYGDNIAFKISYSMPEDKVYAVDYVFHSNKQAAWSEFKKAIEDETSFSKTLKLKSFLGEIGTVNGLYDNHTISDGNDNIYDNKAAFSSFMFSFSVNDIEEISYISFYTNITTSVYYYNETIFDDFAMEMCYRDNKYEPSDNDSDPTKKSVRQIRSVFKP